MIVEMGPETKRSQLTSAFGHGTDRRQIYPHALTMLKEDKTHGSMVLKCWTIGSAGE